MLDSQRLARFREIVGPAGVLTGPDAHRGHVLDAGPRGDVPACLLRPASTAEVSECLALCHTSGIEVVPQGGMSGLVGGTRCGPEQVALSLERMRAIEDIDLHSRSVTVQAGVVLSTLQDAVAARGLRFALDLGSRDSATIGGLIATNAGGNQVLRYGMMREQVLGLQAVLADGRVLSHLSKLLKDNTGYDWASLFVGSEGTLGVVTRAVLRLREPVVSRATAWIAVERYETVLELLRTAESCGVGQLVGYEVMWAEFVREILEHGRHRAPPSSAAAFHILLEYEGGTDLASRVEAAMVGWLERSGVLDIQLARSQAERRELWAIREDIPALLAGGTPRPYDLSVPIADVPEFLATVRRAIADLDPRLKVIAFGHLGDSNVHVLVKAPLGIEWDDAAIDGAVYRPLRELGGSISAEHGIGRDKRSWLGVSRTSTEMDMMAALRRCFDPRGILNPGVLVGRQ